MRGGIRTRDPTLARRCAQSAVDSASELCVNPHTGHETFGLDRTTRRDFEPSPADPQDRRSVMRNRLLPALAAALPAVLYFLYVARYAIDVPFEDDWNVIPLASNAFHHVVPFQDLWAQYGDTRLFVPNLLFAASGRFDHLDERTIMLFSAAIYVATFVMLLFAFRSYLRAPLTFFPVLALGVVWFSLADVQNALWSFQLGWYLVVFFFVAMTWFLVSRQRRPNLLFVLAIAAAVLASVTEIQGFAVWPVGLVSLIWATPWTRRTAAESAIWVWAALLTTTIYFTAFDTSQSADICRTQGGSAKECSATYGLLHPVQLARFVGALVGNIVPTLPGRWIGAHELLGGAIGIAAVFVVVQSIRERHLETNPLPVLLILFAAVFDLMVTFSRVGLGVAAAGANRYTMPNLVLLTGIVMYALRFARNARPGVRLRGDRLVRRHVVCAVALTAFLVVQGVAATRFGITYGRAQRAYAVNVGRVAVNLAAIPDTKRDCYFTTAVIGPLIGQLHHARRLLVRDRLSMFHGDSYRRYLADGPPNAPLAGWWRARPPRTCDEQ